MASFESNSIRASVDIILGVGLVLVALANPFDQTYCSSGCGFFLSPAFDWLFSNIGHWGPRMLFIAIGALCIWGGVDRISNPVQERSVDASPKDAI
jgi:hypothetical protein